MTAERLTGITAIFSACFSVALGAAFLILGSDLALAQAADSLVDFAGALVLAWVVRVAKRPGDENHPLGHSRAEPLGALALAVIAGMLAVQVATGAIESLVDGPKVRATELLLGLFAAKAAFKALVLRIAAKGKGPAFRALKVDAQNDVLVGLVAVFGYVGIRLGYPEVDAWLALPIALWIGWSGVGLARENIDLLMGIAPPEERRRELLRMAASVPGVIDAHDIRAHHMGAQLFVHIHVSVEAELTVRQGHDIGEEVRARLLQEEDVSHCTVHIDPAAEFPPQQQTSILRSPTYSQKVPR